VSGQTVIYNLRFPGQYYQAETGLNYNYFRDYDPATGRYIESDPIGLAGGSVSTYAYTDENPVNYSDPTGNCPWCVAAAVGAAIGGASAGFTAYLQGARAQDIVVATALGAGAGALSGFTFGAAGTLIVGGASSGLGNTLGQLVSGTVFSNLNVEDIALATVAGTTGGTVAILARAAEYGAVIEALSGGLAAAETQAIFDGGRAFENAYPIKSRKLCN
jgi:RHS repeat-associated protein